MRGTVVILCMCECVCMCVCVSISTPAATHLVYTLKAKSCWASYGIFKICIVWISLKTFCSRPSLFLDKLSINERDGDRFISKLVLCNSSCSSYNSTGSSLATVGYQLRFLALLGTRSADLAHTMVLQYNCMQSVLVHSIYNHVYCLLQYKLQ